MRIFFTFFIIFIFIKNGISQNQDKDYKNNPLWIEMMEQETTNYFEIQKAFTIYFQYHELPRLEEEHWGELNKSDFEEIEKKQLANFTSTEMTIEQKQKAQERDALLYQVKRYKEWLRIVAPRVREDGSIMTMDEWLLLVEKQNQEQKLLEKNNK